MLENVKKLIFLSFSISRLYDMLRKLETDVME